MRQNQHNQGNKNRMRGRNRKGPNPMSRNYESNGPDVKIRGNAAHVAEKYTTLARDAQVSGDRVMAENYLQHAEHYNRIVATAQAQAQAVAEQQQQHHIQSQPDAGNSDPREANGRENGQAGQAMPAKPHEEQAADDDRGDAPVVAQNGDTPEADDKPRTPRARRTRRGPRAKVEVNAEGGETATAAPASTEKAPSEPAPEPPAEAPAEPAASG